MSEHQHHRPKQHSERDDLRDEVLAADDTGMVRNEVDIFTADLQETAEIPRGGSAAPDDKAP